MSNLKDHLSTQSLVWFVRFQSDLGVEDLRELRSLPKNYKKNAVKALHQRAEDIENSQDINDDKDILLDMLGDDASGIDRISKIGEELAIIGLHKTIEIRIKKIAKISELFLPEEILNMYNFNSLLKLFKDKGINFNDIQYYSEYKELILLSNCLKHSGTVSEKLREITDMYGEEHQFIDNCDQHFERLLIPSTQFVANLGEEIISKIKENSTQS